MRPRFLIFISLLALAILAIVHWLRPVQPTATPESPQAVVQSNNVPAAVTSVASELPPVAATPTSPQPTVQETVSGTNPGAVEPREIKLRQMIEAANVPIDFYGQVVDQDTNPVPGVKINVAIQQLYSPSLTNLAVGGTVLRLEKETGADGRFDIHGEKGTSLDMESVHKDGYELEPNAPHSFGSSGGSFDQPVVFKMWSANIHEQLITGEKKFQIVPDGRPYVIDLTKGTIAESGYGDLKVSVKRPAQVALGQKYDWSCAVDAISGGLLQETDSSSSMYSAPSDGYTPSFRFEQKIGNGWGDSTGSERFYVMLNKGQEYGRMVIELYAYYNDHIPGLIRISYAINPSGSHILR
jgi:hypothetical protein